MASSPSIRRCRKCHLPMKGHKAETCGIAPEDLAAAPTLPATPPTTPQNVNAIRANMEIGISRHWRDPSWTPHVAIPPPLPGPADSSPPTVLVDEDGNTIPVSVASDSDNDSSDPPSPIRHTSRRPKTPMAQVMDQAHALSLCDPVLSIVRVSLVDLPRMQATAGQSGLVTSIVRAPWVGPRFKDDSFAQQQEEEDTKKVWVVVGDDPTLVQRTAELQQHFEKVPGAIKDDIVVVQATYKSVILASVIGGLVVLLGMVVMFMQLN